MPTVLRRTLAAALPILLGLLPVASPLCAAEAEGIYERYSDRLYQVQIIAGPSQNKSSYGSGFQIQEDGLMVTNYHVVADAALHPDTYQARYVDKHNDSGSLEIVALDVVNDLALVRKARGGNVIRFAGRMPAQGAQIYSLGNPLNLGSAVVPGTYNGITEHSYYQRIHFTGAVNPGMSGGPVINEAGELIGVNVATAGNQVGFLVPLSKVRALYRRHRENKATDQDFRQHIQQQLEASQNAMIDSILSTDWQTAPFGDTRVLDQAAPFLQCWGRSNKDKDKRFLRVSRNCRTSEDIYLSDSHRTGRLVYQYVWLESDELNDFQFANLVEERYANTRPGNRAGEDDVTNFVCHQDAVARLSGKRTLCAREYKRYPGLYDVLFTSVTQRAGRQALISHFGLSGVSRGKALAFAERFLAVSQ